MKRILLAALLPLACLGCLYTMLLAAGAAVLAEGMPAWAQDPAWGWIVGTPQPTGKDPGLPGGRSFTGGSYDWAVDGHRGPASFACMAPVEGPVRMSSCFGDRQGRDGHAHTGIDWATNHEEGRRVWTPFGGKVTYVGWNGYLGWTVVVENDGWQVILGHLCCGSNGKSSAPTGQSSIAVTAGDLVRAGDLVGRSGNTGASTGPHLHFEVRRCEEKGCRIVDPSAVRLPGQSEPCAWESFGDGPPSSCQP